MRIDRQWSPDDRRPDEPWAPLKSRRRLIALAAEFWQALLDHPAVSPFTEPDDFVFATRSGAKVDAWNMLCWFKEAAVAARVTRRVWLHQLRHTAGTRAAEYGMSALQIWALLGHAVADW